MAEYNTPFTYGIPDGVYTGTPTTASCYEKNGKLLLAVNFAVKDPKTGSYFKKENGYNWEAKRVFALTSADGNFNTKTIDGIKEWAKGWNPTTFNDFYWFQSPDEAGTPFGHLAEIGDVELNFSTGNDGSQTCWVHDPNRPKGRTAYVPDGGVSDASALAAKWGAKAKAMFAASPKKVTAAPAAAPVAKPAAAPAPARPATPARPAAAPTAKTVDDFAEYPKTCDGVFAYFCTRLGETYDPKKHDELWFSIMDEANGEKDPDQLSPADITHFFEVARDKTAK